MKEKFRRVGKLFKRKALKRGEVEQKSKAV